MASLRTFVAAGIALVTLGATAHAADPAWPPPPPPSKPAFTELWSGWYLRGDVGYRFHRIGSIDAAGMPVTDSTFDNTPVVGGGFGYKYQWFRTDFTVDYGPQAKFNASNPVVPALYSMKVDSAVGLANIYADLGSWAGFTPYVGAGVGISYVRTADYTVSNLVPTTPIPTREKWNFAWAAMFGVSFAITQQIALDVGYRYVRLGDAVSGLQPPNFNTATTLKGISAQDVRIGIRFYLD